MVVTLVLDGCAICDWCIAQDLSSWEIIKRLDCRNIAHALKTSISRMHSFGEHVLMVA